MQQKTIKKSFFLKGKGLHTGIVNSIKMLPAAENSGIIFIRTDGKFINRKVLASVKNLISSRLCTTVANGELSISTIEHLMAALAGHQIDNAIIEINGSEVPILDGSAKEFSDALHQSDVVEQKSEKKLFYIKKNFFISDEKKFISISPNNSDQLEIEYTINYKNKLIGKQKKKVVFGNNLKGFKKVFDSRTFCLQSDLKKIFSMGLAKGGGLENAIVISDNSILNPGGLRYFDEFVRHKILDCFGDLYVLGVPLVGKIVCNEGGHELTHKLSKYLFSNFICNFINKKNDFVYLKKNKKNLKKIVVNI